MVPGREDYPLQRLKGLPAPGIPFLTQAYAESIRIQAKPQATLGSIYAMFIPHKPPESKGEIRLRAEDRDPGRPAPRFCPTFRIGTGFVLRLAGACCCSRLEAALAQKSREARIVACGAHLPRGLGYDRRRGLQELARVTERRDDSLASLRVIAHV